MQDRKSTTAERLTTIMKTRNMRQSDIIEAVKPFSKKYGVKIARNNLSQYVNGRCEPRQKKLTILALALGVSEAWLMGYDVSPFPTSEAFSAEAPAQNDSSPGTCEDLCDRPEMQILITALNGATQQDIKDAAALIEMFKKKRRENL